MGVMGKKNHHQRMRINFAASCECDRIQGCRRSKERSSLAVVRQYLPQIFLQTCLCCVLNRCWLLEALMQTGLSQQ